MAWFEYGAVILWCGVSVVLCKSGEYAFCVICGHGVVFIIGHYFYFMSDSDSFDWKNFYLLLWFQ